VTAYRSTTETKYKYTTSPSIYGKVKNFSLRRHCFQSRGSSVNTVTELGAGQSEFDFQQEQGFFLFTTASRPALGPTQSIKWVRGGDPSPGIKRPEHEANHSPPFSAEVKNGWSFTSTPPYVFTAWCSLTHKIRLLDWYLNTGTTLPLLQCADRF
jgi:hypothetical protein